MKRVSILFILLFFVRFGFAQEFPLDTIMFGGNTEKHINIVVLGDGYLESQLDIFSDDVTNFVEDWFNQEPFKEYKNYFNVFAIRVPSKEEGASMDPNKLIDNYFGSSFFAYGIERLLVSYRKSKVTSVLASNFPNYDQVILLVNSTKYGGSGGWVATASTNYLSSEIAIHEIGHSFANLGDEYWAGSQYASERANRTKEHDPELVRWKDWIDINEVGIYEYESPGNGWYRPHQNCKMRKLNKPFCPVCREQLLETIHQLSNLISNYYPEQIYTPHDTLPAFFAIQPIVPNPNTLLVEWKLNDKIVSNSIDSLFLNDNLLISGENKIEVTVTDTSEFSKKVQPATYKTETIYWKVNHTVTSAPTFLALSKSFNFFPNPSFGLLNVNYQLSIPGKSILEISDLNGKTLKVFDFGIQTAGQYQANINLEQIPAQILLLKFRAQHSVVVKKLILRKKF